MIIIPAIDLGGGKCVRLRQGREEESTEYSATPVAIAEEWRNQGAEVLHIVNLDGAFGRTSGNLEILRRIASDVLVHVQYGGGLRTLESMQEALEAGAWKLVVGTVAVEDPSLLREALSRFGADRLIIALDALEGRVVTRGWKFLSNRPVLELAGSLQEMGVKEVLYTDVARDGMLAGPNLGALVELASTGLWVIASGGVSSPGDIRAILSLDKSRISGVIVGKALYEKRVTLRELIDVTLEFPAKP
jgi:phosphoribosylformimino-5-aminoimidazole carboxamide ribotide isomerase